MAPRFEKSVDIIVLDEPHSPYKDGSHAYRRWQRHSRPDWPEARWFPEDEDGNVYPYEAFHVVKEVGGDSFLEQTYRRLKSDAVNDKEPSKTA